MTRARAFRWGAILLIGIGAGVVLGQVVSNPAPTVQSVPRPGEPMPEYTVRVVNVPVDPWWQRYSVFIITSLIGVLSWAAKAKVTDPLRSEMREQGAGIRAELKEESGERREALLQTTALFREALSEMRGTVKGLDTGVAALGPAISGMIALGEKSAVAFTRIEALDQRMTRVEDLSHGVRDARG